MGAHTIDIWPTSVPLLSIKARLCTSSLTLYNPRITLFILFEHSENASLGYVALVGSYMTFAHMTMSPTTDEHGDASKPHNTQLSIENVHEKATTLVNFLKSFCLLIVNIFRARLICLHQCALHVIIILVRISAIVRNIR